jgi:hypothetical protein
MNLDFLLCGLKILLELGLLSKGIALNRTDEAERERG